MGFKNLLNFSSLVTFGLLPYSFSAYALGDVMGGVGYSAYHYNSNDPSSEAGYNLNASILWPIIGINPIASFVVGPTLKQETVNGDAGASTGLRTKETFTTLQLGGEGGVRVNVIPSFTLYGTVLLSYGISNTLTEDITGGGIFIPDQTVKPSVDQSWQVGVNARGFYNVNSSFGVGLGVGLINGSYSYGSSTLNTIGGGAGIDGGTSKYSATNINLLAVFYL